MSKEEKRSLMHPFSYFPRALDEFFWGLDALPFHSSGLSVSEDEKHVYIEAHMPGIREEDIEVSLEKGVLHVSGERQEEEKDEKKKFYRKASNSFSYRINIPSNVDESQEPEADYVNGVLKITFAKSKVSNSKKISIKKR